VSVCVCVCLFVGIHLYHVSQFQLPEVNEVVAALFTADNLWYRAKVVAAVDATKTEVRCCGFCLFVCTYVCMYLCVCVCVCVCVCKVG
jgi:hypothetical protein